MKKKTLPDGFAFDSETAVSIIDELIENNEMDKVSPNVFNPLNSKDELLRNDYYVRENGIEAFMELCDQTRSEKLDKDQAERYLALKESGIYHYLTCLGILDSYSEKILTQKVREKISEEDYIGICTIVNNLYDKTGVETEWFCQYFLEYLDCQFYLSEYLSGYGTE